MFRTIKRRILDPENLVCILLGVATGLSANVRADGEMVTLRIAALKLEY